MSSCKIGSNYLFKKKYRSSLGRLHLYSVPAGKLISDETRWLARSESVRAEGKYGKNYPIGSVCSANWSELIGVESDGQFTIRERCPWRVFVIRQHGRFDSFTERSQILP